MLVEGVAAPIRARSIRGTDLVVVFALAAAVRLGLVAFSAGGFSGNYGYDPSVYFAASDALIHGRVPYTDFVLLHPPGLMLALTPFAALGQLIGDHPAFVVASVAFALLGASSATFVARIASAWGLSRRAALTGGLFYAVWLSAAGPEIGVRLEPLGSFAFLGGVLLLTRNTTRSIVAAGAALGVAVSAKIWWVVPLLIVVGWYAARPSQRRAAVRLTAGAAAALLLIFGPFFAVAPKAMWRMIVSDQLGRHTVHASVLGRLFTLSSLDQLGSGHGLKIVGLALAGAVGVGVVLLAWRPPVARLYVVVAAAQLIVLMLAPSYFGYYSGFAAPGVALVVAAAADRWSLRRPATVLPPVALMVTAAVTAGALVTTATITTPKPLPVGRLATELRGTRCVVADSPMALIALDALSRGLADGCPNWVDVSGRTYDVDAAPGGHVARSRNPLWQRDLRRYLLSGDAVVVIRSATGLSPALMAEIHRLPVLARAGSTVVYRVTR